MTARPKYILHSPLSDVTRLDTFIENCLTEGVSLIAVFGSGSAELEDMIDEIIVGDGKDDSRFICTTSHPNETFDDVLSFVEAWELNDGGAIIEARL
ncbi:hypothetical protein [uncultured Roseovarius sp.]|uniref:hypothetical protein n=1 Tax=uncultured Roseovarius sp. TaxID=293344 RepID=UPI00262D0A3A|nr:hypothetical protein [uncultured Roseovarius sp.]